MMSGSLYHAALRSMALTLALVLLFDSGLVSPVTKQLSQQSQQFVATAIGMHAAVEATPLNQTTAALTQKERELEAREAAIAAREIEVSVGGLAGGANPANVSTYLLSVLLFILLLLIVINYVLDFTRARTISRAVNV